MSKATHFRRGAAPTVTAYVYGLATPPGNGNGGVGPFRDAFLFGNGNGSGSGESGKGASGEEVIQARENEAWERGVREGESRARTEFDQLLKNERDAMIVAMENFERERRAYFQQAEAEVVHLALAIARRILHREAQMDPLLLRGVVRVALEKVAAATELKLRLHPGEVRLWEEFLASQPDMETGPQLVADPSRDPGQCVLETTLGATDLSWETQLKEVEQGFFDLLALRPRG